MVKMEDAKVVGRELLVDSFKKVVNEKLQFSEDDVQDWIYMDTPKSVMIVTITEDQEIVLVRLYRHNLRANYHELPAGEVDHEDWVSGAKRELLEETGFTSDEIVDMGKYYALPSETNRWVHYYLALNAKKVQEPKPDTLIEKYFNMSVVIVPFDKVSTIKGASDFNIRGLESLHGIALAKETLENRK